MSFSEYFRIGGQLEAAGRYDDAFAAYAEANRLQRQTLDPAAAEASEIESLAQIQRDFTPALFAAHAGGERAAAPIFIVGLPRTGAALIERILAAHPQVQAMGETPHLHDAVNARFPTGVAVNYAPAPFRQAAEAYLAAMKKAGWRSQNRPVDRQLSNRWLLGAARMMFPNATIVHAIRDPLETCVLNYIVQFERGSDLACDLAEIGRQYVRYRTLMDHWVKVLPGKMVHVNREGLMAEPEANIRALVELCDLPWHDACLGVLEEHRKAVAVDPDAPQSLDGEIPARWRRFEGHLRPLGEALGPYLNEVRT